MSAYRTTIMWSMVGILAFASGLLIKLSPIDQDLAILPITLIFFTLYKLFSAKCPSCEKPLMFEDRGEQTKIARRHWPEKTCSRCGEDLTLVGEH